MTDRQSQMTPKKPRTESRCTRCSSRFLAAFAYAVFLTTCGDPGEVIEPQAPPRATAISISPDSVNLSFIGATATLTATVTDQYGATFPGTVTWASDAPSVFSVTTNGVVTGVSNGSGSVRASIASLSDAASVTVSQVPATIQVVSGSDQEALPGAALGDPVVVRILDQGGRPAAGTTVSFLPSSDHGSADPDSVTTNIAGDAATEWTLGEKIGPQLLTAAVSNGPKARVTATGTTGHAIEVFSGSRQRALPGKELPEPVVVRVLDSKGEPFQGTTVVFATDDRHGSVAPDSTKTDADGEAATIWTLGDNKGVQTLAASVAFGPSTDIHATGLTGLGVCDRTPQIRRAIMSAAGRHDCADVTSHQLERITVFPYNQLAHSGITALYNDDFAGLSNLDSLDLSDNRLTELPSGLFAPLKSLKLLDLSGYYGCLPPSCRASDYRSNQIKELPDDIFDGLSSLRYLSLAGTQLRALTPGVFRDLAALQSLSLLYSQLASLSPGVFDGLVGLKQLNLAHNELQVLPSRVFADLVELEHLDISRNQIRDMESDTWSALSSLRTLKLYDNRFSQLASPMFSGLESLDSLSVGNDIATIPSGTFSSLANLSYLSLGTVDFSQVGDGTSGALRLTDLFVSAQEATGLRSGMFAGSPSLTKLGLNTFAVDDGAYPSADVLFSQLDSLGASPASVGSRGKEVGGHGWNVAYRLDSGARARFPDDLFAGLGNLEYLWLFIRSEEVEFSEGTFRSLPQLKMIWLWSQGLAPLPEGVFSGVTGLEQLAIDYHNGGNAPLAVLPSDVFGGLDHLRLLWLHQSVTELESSVFSGLSSLERLSLYGNHLTSLPEGLFRGLYNLGALDLAHNPGAPFPISLSVVRTDTTDLSAPGPARVVVTIAEGALGDVTVSLNAPGASLSSSSVTVLRGRVRSDAITVTRSESHQGPVVLKLSDPSTLLDPGSCLARRSPCYTGVYISLGDSLSIFR